MEYAPLTSDAAVIVRAGKAGGLRRCDFFVQAVRQGIPIPIQEFTGHPKCALSGAHTRDGLLSGQWPMV
eukprot:1161277-Pelagomonas_calceolata.AAC.1